MKEKCIALLILAFINCFLNLHAAQEQHDAKTLAAKNPQKTSIAELHLFVGETHLFKTKAIVEKVAVGSSNIVNAAVVNENEILLSAQQIGMTTFSVWNQDGKIEQVRIYVLAHEVAKNQREVLHFISNIPGVQATVIGEKIILEGENLSNSDQEKIAAIAKHYPHTIDFTNRVGWEKMVTIDVKVAEFPSNVLREIGMTWNVDSSINIDGKLRYGTTGPDLTSFFTSIHALLLSKLNLLAHTGEAVILAEPKLSTRNGSKAIFFAGGEIPYQVSEENNRRNIVFKPYGVKLDIQPHVDHNNVIRAVIETEVSSIDTSISVEGGPALRTRKTKAEFNLRNGETIVLSGFLSKEQIRQENKLPWLSRLPVLGPLFRSKKFRQQETELMIFVTPSVENTDQSQHLKRLHEIKQKMQSIFEQPQ